MTKIAAVVSTLSILGFVLVRYLSGPPAIAYVLFAVAAAAIAFLLVRAYTAVSRIEGARCTWANCRMRAHILLHLVPSSYLILQLFTKATFFVNAAYLVPIVLFFFTGRQMWGRLFERFGAKMYRFFYAGNTGMSAAFPLLLGLGILVDERFGSEVFRRVLLAYFAIHFLLTGVAVWKIEKDVSKRGSGDVTNRDSTSASDIEMR